MCVCGHTVNCMLTANDVSEFEYETTTMGTRSADNTHKNCETVHNNCQMIPI